MIKVAVTAAYASAYGAYIRAGGKIVDKDHLRGRLTIADEPGRLSLCDDAGNLSLAPEVDNLPLPAV